MTVTLHDALKCRRTQREFDDRDVPFDIVERLLWAAQGVTAEDGRRTAPSAHALHPLRLVFVAGRISELGTGVHTVDGTSTALSQTVSRDVRGALQDAAIDDQPWIGRAAGIITVCADFVAPAKDFANQAPYGTRGLRYVYVEAGAVAQNVALQAAAEGLACVLVAGFHDEATAGILELEAPIAPVLHLCFGWPTQSLTN